MDPHTATLPIRSSVNGVLTRVDAIHQMRACCFPAQTQGVVMGRPRRGVGVKHSAFICTHERAHIGVVSV